MSDIKSIRTIDVCDSKINEVIKVLLDQKVKAKLTLNFDGTGRVIPELTVHNESLFKIILVEKTKI